MSATLVLALAFVSAPPAAQLLPNQPIIVEGRDLRDRASDYVDKMLPTTFAGQFGRYEDPICVKTVGLTEPLSREVIDRMQLVAKTVGVEVDNPSCTPNLILITTPDKRALIATLRKSRPAYVNGISTEELNRQANSPRPFATWQMVELIAADGMRIGGSDSFPGAGNLATDGVHTFHDQNAAPLKTTVTPSRLRSNAKAKLMASIVVVETGALRGATAWQLADFALVRGVTPLAGKGEAPNSSILSLFNAGVTPETAPQSLTWWDVAFLKSLVNTRSDALANVQRNEIRNHMIKEVEKAPIAER